MYGKIEVRAKLPKGGGTWPAIWMLGDNFDQVDWPQCGEIDIMEHDGFNEGRIHTTVHRANDNGDPVYFTSVKNEIKNGSITARGFKKELNDGLSISDFDQGLLQQLLYVENELASARSKYTDDSTFNF